MTDARADAVEAAAKAICEDQERSGGPPWDMWPEKERSGRIAKETFRNQARDAISAYLAHMAAAGWVMVRDVPAALLENDDDKMARGWNACRAAMLGKGEG